MGYKQEINILIKKIISKFNLKESYIIFQEKIDDGTKEPLTLYIYNKESNPVEYISDVIVNIMSQKGIITPLKVIIEISFEIILVLKYLFDEEFTIIKIPQDINIKCKTKHDMSRTQKSKMDYLEELYADNKFNYKIEIPLKLYDREIKDYLKNKTLSSNPLLKNVSHKIDYLIDGPTKIDKGLISVTPIELSISVDLYDNITIEEEIVISNFNKI